MTTFNALNHIHLAQCESTQIELKSLIKKEGYKPSLLTTSQQTNGFGRRGTSWEFNPGSLAFSLCIPLNLTPTLIPLAMGVYICEFFKDKDLKLKWPNDIFTNDSKKCGGIICELLKDNWALIGIGLNLSPGNYSYIKVSKDPKALAYELAKTIINNPLSDEECLKKWQMLCIHLNKEIVVKDDSKQSKGKFIGVGKWGQARIQTPTEINELYTGSLFIQ